MSKLELTGIPEQLVQRLEAAARVHGRDVAAEAAVMIERGLEAAERVERELAGVRSLRQRMPDAWVTDEMIREARNEGRA